MFISFDVEHQIWHDNPILEEKRFCRIVMLGCLVVDGLYTLPSALLVSQVCFCSNSNELLSK